MTLFRANQLAGTATALTSGGMQAKLLRYAQLLTSQGSLETALGYLGDCVDVSSGFVTRAKSSLTTLLHPYASHSRPGQAGRVNKPDINVDD